MSNIIVILTVAVIVAAAAAYVIRAKKKGVTCVGCPAGGHCSANCVHSECGHCPSCESCSEQTTKRFER